MLINPNAEMIRSHAPTFNSIMTKMHTVDRQANGCSIIEDHSKRRARAPILRVWFDIAPSKHDCQACALKQRCVPKEPARKVTRTIQEGAREMARDIAKTDAYVVSRCQRKKVEMLFAHLKRILKLDRLLLRGPNGARDEFLLAAIAQNLRKLAKLIPQPA